MIQEQFHIQYLTDPNGNNVAVQIPYREWARLIDDYHRLEKYCQLKSHLRESFKEIEAIESGQQSASTLSDFLAELEH